jgi:hypothetical protein
MKWEFEGCYVLNLRDPTNKISKYHFYTDTNNIVRKQYQNLLNQYNPYNIFSKEENPSFYKNWIWIIKEGRSVNLIKNVRRVCIQPLRMLDSSHLNDDDSKIDERLAKWFLNNQNIKNYDGFDILGQPHGDFYIERMNYLKEGMSWDEANEHISKLNKSDEKVNIHHRLNYFCQTSNLLNEESILLFLRILKKVDYLDFF